MTKSDLKQMATEAYKTSRVIMSAISRLPNDPNTAREELRPVLDFLDDLERKLKHMADTLPD